MSVRLKNPTMNWQKMQLQGTSNSERQNECSTQQTPSQFEVFEAGESKRHWRNCNSYRYNVRTYLIQPMVSSQTSIRSSQIL